jgi:GNAT superfamily N-acetyltransferase
MPEEDYDELYHLTDNPEFSGLDPHHVPSTISEEESPGIYLTNDPHSHVGTNLDKPYIATFRVPVGYEDHPAFEPDHYGKSGDYFVSPEWYDHIQFAGISPNPAHKKGGSDRTAAVHDRLMQIVAMADTTPWHPLITSTEDSNSRHGRGKDKSYFIENPDTYQPIAQLEVTLHNKGDKHWRNSEPGRPSGFYLRDHNEAHINSIIVHPEFQGQGVAQALIERLNSDHPEYKINPGVTTPKGYGLVQQLKKLIPDSEAKMSPNYKPYVMDDGESAEYEKSEYANVGHEDYEYDDYTSEYKPRKLVNASYDDGPYYAMAWDDEDEDDEDEPSPKGRKHGNDLANAPHYVGYDEPPYVGKHRKEEEPSRLRKWLRSWHPDEIALPPPKKRVARVPAEYRIEQSPTGKSWSAYHDSGTYAGGISVATDKHSGQKYVYDLNVKPDHRRKGIGTALWEEAGRPLHTPLEQTEDGAAWAKSVGGEDIQGTDYEPQKRTSARFWHAL